MNYNLSRGDFMKEIIMTACVVLALIGIIKIIIGLIKK